MPGSRCNKVCCNFSRSETRNPNLCRKSQRHPAPNGRSYPQLGRCIPTSGCSQNSHRSQPMKPFRLFITFVSLSCALLTSTSPVTADEATTSAEPKKPNIVLIYIDDLGYGDIGSYGCKDIPTPNIDQLAAEGVRCTASYITNPPCCPSRCSLMMGQYGQRFGKYGMSRGLPIPTDRPTIAEFLQE